jgi:hypothetical protein
MTQRTPVIVLVSAALSVTGCAPQPAWDETDPATMLYRECMRAQSGQWNTADAGAAMGDPGSRNTASFEASADRKREQREHMECLKQARPPED